jgi:hypothetical protein
VPNWHQVSPYGLTWTPHKLTRTPRQSAQTGAEYVGESKDLEATKSSSKAKSQQKASQSSFSPIQFNTDNAGSEYNGSENEGLSSDNEALSSDDDDNTLQSISAMQTLYSVFLPAHLRPKEGNSRNLVSFCKAHVRYDQRSNSIPIKA